jgi:hypothetical protein
MDRRLAGLKLVDTRTWTVVYAAVDTGDKEYGRRIVSLRGGRVLSSAAPLPWLMLGESGPTC